MSSSGLASSVTMTSSAASVQLNDIDASETNDESTHNFKPIIVGLYGVPGCGKSNLLERLKSSLGEGDFAFFELDGVVDGEFVELSESQQIRSRIDTIKQIQKVCALSRKVGVVVGEFFWFLNNEKASKLVFTKAVKAILHISYTLALRKNRSKDSALAAPRKIAPIQPWSN
ncbi:hypothetical protein BJ875DRAFT_442749 [Amylocarpus encephaloides]|uniref:Uncharacterized protein n=1 Tax=Amylocarpus encephaloides TaxID=45428 RepID=A0A9P7YFU6_9HELO|nr:hypothetical protein BJ875DRAFT_442749 [Amylocarpus encephaloides]